MMRLCRPKGMIDRRHRLYFEGFLKIKERKTGWLVMYMQERRCNGPFKRLFRRNHFAEIKGTHNDQP